MNSVSDRSFNADTSPIIGRYVLEASAGTGKTYSLMHIALRLIVEEAMRIDRILLITFTKAATSELRGRLAQILGGLHEHLSRGGAGPSEKVEGSDLLEEWSGRIGLDLVKSRLAAAVELIDEAPIYTIHSFCSRMYEGYAFSSGSGYGVKFDSQACSRAAADAVNDFMLKKFAAMDPETAEALLAYDLEGILRSALDCSASVSEGERLRVFPGVGEELASLLEDFFKEVPEKLADEKKRLGIQNFNDQLKNMADACRNFPEFRKRVGESYDAVLVDEFQDTDPLQFRIIRECFLAEEEGRGLPRTLFIVGDPKQSIYRFRGADLGAYLQARAEIGCIRELDRNYRSAPAIVKAVNALFGVRGRDERRELALRKVKNPGADQGAFLNPEITSPEVKFSSSKLPLMKKTSDGALHPVASFELWRTDFIQLSVDEASALEAWFVAEDIADLYESGALLNAGTPDERRFRFSDAAALVRSRKDAEALKKELALRGIPYVDSVEGDVLTTDEAFDVLCCLNAMEQPSDRALLARARATRLYGESMSHLAAKEGAEERLLEASELFSEAARVREKRGVSAAFALVMQKRGTYSRLSEQIGGRARIINFEHVLEALESESRRRRTLSGLVEWMKHECSSALAGAEVPDERKIRSASDVDAVKIETIHKSKGLQYPVVYVLAMWRNISYSEGRMVKVDSKQYFVPRVDGIKKNMNEFAPQDELENASEAVRIFYVAATRAACRLVMAFFPAAAKRKNLYFHPSFKRSCLTCSAAGSTEGIADPDALIEYLDAVPEHAAGGADADEGFREVADALAEHCPGVDRNLSRSDFWRTRVLDRGECTRPGLKIDAAESELELEAFEPKAGRISEEWARSSFSAIASLADSAADGELKDDECEEDEVEQSVQKKAEEDEADPVFDFPRGAEAGTLLHKMFEVVEPADAAKMSADELADAVESVFRTSVCRFSEQFEDWERCRLAACLMLKRAALAPILPDGSSLSSVDPSRSRHEMDFLLKSDCGGMSAGEFGRILAWLEPRLFSGLASESTRSLSGYLAGSMDYVFEHDGLYWVVDWKSNYISSRLEDYSKKGVEALMTHSNYWLQGFIYLSALRSFVGDPEKIGGAQFLFLRGIREDGGFGAGLLDMSEPAVKLLADAVHYLLTEGPKSEGFKTAAAQYKRVGKDEAWRVR